MRFYVCHLKMVYTEHTCVLFYSIEMEIVKQTLSMFFFLDHSGDFVHTILVLRIQNEYLLVIARVSSRILTQECQSDKKGGEKFCPVCDSLHETDVV